MRAVWLSQPGGKRGLLPVLLWWDGWSLISSIVALESAPSREGGRLRPGTFFTQPCPACCHGTWLWHSPGAPLPLLAVTVGRGRCVAGFWRGRCSQRGSLGRVVEQDNKASHRDCPQEQCGMSPSPTSLALGSPATWPELGDHSIELLPFLRQLSGLSPALQPQPLQLVLGSLQPSPSPMACGGKSPRSHCMPAAERGLHSELGCAPASMGADLSSLRSPACNGAIVLGCSGLSS